MKPYFPEDARLARADGYGDDLLCSDCSVWAVPRPRSVASAIFTGRLRPMQRRKARVIGQAAAFTLLLPSLVSADAAEVTTCSLVGKPSSFDRQTITLQGIATAVKRTTSRRGNDYMLFKVQGPDGCGTVDVFIWGHPKISDGDRVRVEGVFETVHHQDHLVFHNQIEATKVFPAPK
jgi:hypothetical protein